MGTFGTSGRSATRPTAATATGRAQPGARPGGCCPGRGAWIGGRWHIARSRRGRRALHLALPGAGTAAGTREPAGMGSPWPAGARTRRHLGAMPGPVQPDTHDDGSGQLDVQRQPGRLQICRIGRWANTANGSGMPGALPATVELGAKPEHEGGHADHGGGGYERHSPVADGEVAKQHQERDAQVEAVLDGATGGQAVTGGLQHTGREKLRRPGREERRKQVRVVAGQAGQDVHRPGGPVRARDQQPDRIPGDQQEDQQRRGQPARQRAPAPARRGDAARQATPARQRP